MTAPRAKVHQTTNPSISDPQSNRQTGGNMTEGVGSARTNTRVRHGATPGTNTGNSRRAPLSMVFDETVQSANPTADRQE